MTTMRRIDDLRDGLRSQGGRSDAYSAVVDPAPATGATRQLGE